MLVTHSHWDHFTRALDWRERHSIPILLGSGERHSIEQLDLSRGPYPQQVRYLRKSGAPDLAEVIDQTPLEDHERGHLVGPPNRWLEDGETVEHGRGRIVATATPGHTRGHVVFDLPAMDVAFTGDHLLPRITPSLGFEHVPEPSPLTSYLESLAASAESAPRQMLPAHGALTMTTDTRARELLAHHQERLDEIHEAVTGGVSTAGEIAQGMRWTRRDRDLSELSPMHAMTAILEVRSHLLHLVRVGRLSMNDGAIETFHS